MPINTDEKSLPWWKSDKMGIIVIPSFIAAYTLMMGLVVALLIHTLDKVDQQFTAQTARIDYIFSEMNDIKNEMVNIRGEMVDLRQEVRANGEALKRNEERWERNEERLDRIEDMLRILLERREDEIREQAQLSQ